MELAGLSHSWQKLKGKVSQICYNNVLYNLVEPVISMENHL